MQPELRIRVASTVTSLCSFKSASLSRDERHLRLRTEQTRDYNRLAFPYNPAYDNSLSRHVLINTMTEVCPYCKVLKFNIKTIEMCCATENNKLLQPSVSPELLKTLLAGYPAYLKNFLSNFRNKTYAFK